MYEEELAFANELADEAAKIGMHYFQSEFRVEQKADLTPVTQADLEIEGAIREAIAERYPNDAVLGEEEGLVGDSDRVWVIDPVDGTKNFAAGIQIWGNLIALVDRDEPVVGVVGAPALRERYSAAKGAGATVNDDPIHVSDVSAIEEAFVLFGTLAWIDPTNERRFRGLVQRAKRTRAFGDFWAHMLVARGAAEVMIEEELRTWDTAAVRVVVEEAGGRITSFEGGQVRDRSSVVTTNRRLHPELLRRLGGLG